MPNITGTDQVAFTNNTARVLADSLARCYYTGNLAKQMYDALGGGATALADTSVLNQIRKAAAQWRQTFSLCFEREAEWFLKGTTSFIANDTSQVIDGSPADGRPAVTGAKVVAVLARATEFANAVRSATFGFSDAARNSLAYYNRVIVVSDIGLSSMSVADGQNFVDATALLKTNYEATSLANLNSLLVIAVNPGAGG